MTKSIDISSRYLFLQSPILEQKLITCKREKKKILCTKTKMKVLNKKKKNLKVVSNRLYFLFRRMMITKSQMVIIIINILFLL